MIARGSTAAVIGAAGGIGAALAVALRDAGFARVVGLSRHGSAPGPGIEAGVVDIEDEASIARAVALLAQGPALRLVVVATGLLHAHGIAPERSVAALDADAMTRSFAVNAIGPALVAKHVMPVLAREGRAVFAALSARVGSISDNRLGGWHSYRASKAALNMIVRNLAIEAARRRPEQVWVGLHPGTVRTRLSAPFGKGLPAGQVRPPADAARRMLLVIDALDPSRSGACIAWDGATIAP